MLFNKFHALKNLSNTFTSSLETLLLKLLLGKLPQKVIDPVEKYVYKNYVGELVL